MGEIRKDNLHESLIEELNELANIDLSGKQDKTDESLLTESKDVIGAINELFQNANNGKELIASAIGEPLSSEDTFSAMSNDINGLLSTFKTNMMNNGITVESGDKFKALIDKIATMVEEGEGKGIKYASGNGVISYRNLRDVGFPVNIDFTPTLLFVDFVGVYNSNTCCNVMTGDCIAHIGDCSTNGKINFILKYENGYVKTVSLDMNLTYNNIDNTTEFTWYAIGVGEEDTTLRDSLASILEDEGVDVTEEDDMASLITKVDEEFDEKNNISKVTQVVASDNELFRIYNPSPGKTTYTYQYTSICEIVCTFEGSIRVCFDAYISQGSCSVYCELYRGETIVDTEIFTIDQTAFNSASKKTYDFLDVKCGDIIRLDSNIGTTVSCYIRNIILKGDIIL